jgi:hypothetical protein
LKDAWQPNGLPVPQPVPSRQPPQCPQQLYDCGRVVERSVCGGFTGKQDSPRQPDLERFLAKRMNATTYEVESSHVVMLSHPEFVLDVIRDAATAIQGNG